MIIDGHAHVGKGEFLNDVFQLENDPQRIVYLMDKAGVDKTVIFPVKYTDYEKANIEVAELCKENPRFIGFARVNGASPKTPGLIDYAIRELGLKGIKIHPQEGFPTRETMNKINELKVPVLFHSGIGTPPLLFEGIVKCYPDVPVILAHLGTDLDFNNMFSYPEQALRLARENKNVYLDTAASSFIQAILERAVDKLGAGKIIFGTDSPWFYPALTMACIRDLEISDGEKDRILGLNMAQLLNL